MFENFRLKKTADGEVISGYIWDAAEPDMIVCIIHGIGEYAGRYERVAQRMLAASMAVISMDLRGHGISGGKRGHCAPREQVLEDIDDLLRYAAGKWPGVPVALYGHSMGGNIVLDYRARGTYSGSLKCYVASAPWIMLYAQPSGIYNLFVRTVARIKPANTISSKVDEADLGNPDSIGDYNNDPLVHDMISAQCAVEGFDIGRALGDGTYPEDGSADGIPVLLMHGTADRICNIEGSRSFSRHHSDICEYVEWEGLCHEIHNGGPDSTGDEVIDKAVSWLRSVLDR